MDIPQKFDNLPSKDKQKVTNLINKLYGKREHQDKKNQQDIQIFQTEDLNIEELSMDDYGKAGKQDRAVRRPPTTQIKQVSEQGTYLQKKPNQLPPAVNKTRATIGTVDTNLAIDSANRPNLFVDNAKKIIGGRGLNAHKQDTDIDRKLHGDNDLAERGERQSLVNIACNRCGRSYTVSNKLVFNSGDGVRYTCDSCITRRKQ